MLASVRKEELATVCGCWCARQIYFTDLGEGPRRMGRFAKEAGKPTVAFSTSDDSTTRQHEATRRQTLLLLFLMCLSDIDAVHVSRSPRCLRPLKSPLHLLTMSISARSVVHSDTCAGCPRPICRVPYRLALRTINRLETVTKMADRLSACPPKTAHEGKFGPGDASRVSRYRAKLLARQLFLASSLLLLHSQFRESMCADNQGVLTRTLSFPSDDQIDSPWPHVDLSWNEY